MKGLQRSCQRPKTWILITNCVQCNITSVLIVEAIITRSGTVDEKVQGMGDRVMETVPEASVPIEVEDPAAEAPLEAVMVDLQKLNPVVIPDFLRGPEQQKKSIGSGVDLGIIQRKIKAQKRRNFQSLRWVRKDHLPSNKLSLPFQTIVLICIVISIHSGVFKKQAPNCCCT